MKMINMKNKIELILKIILVHQESILSINIRIMVFISKETKVKKEDQTREPQEETIEVVVIVQVRDTIRNLSLKVTVVLKIEVEADINQSIAVSQDHLTENIGGNTGQHPGNPQAM